MVGYGKKAWRAVRRVFHGGAVLVCAAALCCAFAVSAFAEENRVNPQQLPDSSFIYDSTIAELATADAYFDNQTVQIVGEVVGDNISAEIDGSYRWITLFDGMGSTIDTYMPRESAARIDSFGRYGVTGTSLQVRGTFHLACPEHEGLSDVHAENVVVMKAGGETPDEFNVQDFIPGAVLLGVGLLSVILYSYLRERQR